MARTFYDDLGVKPDATKAEMRTAYRKLVLQHHPDRSDSEESKTAFLKAREAYEVLSDAEKRKQYDEHLELIARRAKAATERRATEAKREAEAARLMEERKATPSGATVREEVVRLQSLFGSGRHSEAEKLAYTIMQLDPRQAIPYAVLADILRGRGYVNEAGKMYAYAAQMDPTNPVYQRRYEQLLRNSRLISKHGNMRLEQDERNYTAPLVGGGFAVLGSLYVAVSPEAAMTSRIPFIASWTPGLIIVLFLSGVAIGSALAVGNLLERFGMMASSSAGRSSPTAILGIVALANFWVSAILYVMIATGLRAFNFSTTRLMLGVAAVTLLLTAASIPSSAIHASETFLWGGNLVYVGGLVGWMAADAMRSAA